MAEEESCPQKAGGYLRNPLPVCEDEAGSRTFRLETVGFPPQAWQLSQLSGSELTLN